MKDILKTIFYTATLLTSCIIIKAQDVPTVTWDSKSLMIDGQRVCPVMGEVH